MTLTNQGPSNGHRNLSLVDVFPDGGTFRSGERQRRRWVGLVRDGVIIDEFASLASGAVVVLTIAVTPTRGSATSLTNSASIEPRRRPRQFGTTPLGDDPVKPAADLSVSSRGRSPVKSAPVGP